MPSALVADLTRFTNDASLSHRQAQLNWRRLAHVLLTERTAWAVCEFRARQWAARKGGAVAMAGKVVGIFTKHLSELLTGVYLPTSTVVGPGLLIPHFGTILVNGHSVIGEDCTIHSLSHLAYHDGGSPIVGDRVFIGPGARILGGVTIGDEAMIGANAVVMHDVPAGHVAVGPAASARPNPKDHWMSGA